MKTTQGKKIYKIAVSGLVIILVMTGLLFFQKMTGKESTKTSSNQKKTAQVSVTELTKKGTKEGSNEKPTVTIKPVPTDYEATVKVNAEEKTLSGTLQIKATNYTGVNHDRIYFHLYPNQFRETKNLKGGFWDKIMDEHSLPGWIDITNVKVNNQEIEYKLADTVMEVPLENWKQDEMIVLNMAFTIKIPKNNGRFSYDDHTIWLGNWLPIQAVYDENGWVTDPYYSLGDPFYSEVGKYSIHVNVPAGYKVATTGLEAAPHQEQDGTLSYHTIIESVRDFSLVVMDPYYQIMTAQVGSTKVNAWYLNTDLKDSVKENLDTAVKSLAYFSRVYGPYAYPEFDIVRTGMFTAMEYPGIIYIPNEAYTDPEQSGVTSVAHEAAHQWWYGMVGNNEVAEPWLDEALTTYSTTRFLLEENPAIGKNLLDFRSQMAEGMDRFENQGQTIGSPVHAFSNAGTYSPIVYQKGAMMLDELEKVIGTTKMDEILSKYFLRFQFKNAKSSDFISIFEEELGPEAKEYFEAWLNGDEPKFKWNQK